MKRHAVVFAVLLIGCGGDTGRSGADDVDDLFAQRCSGAGCHIDHGQQPGGQLDLSPDVMCAQLIGVPAVEVATQVRVEPGDAAASYLWCKLAPECEQRPPGATQMPLGASLAPDELDLVAAWIDAGAPGCAGVDEQPPVFAGAASATPLASAIRIDWEPADDDTSPASAITYLVYQAERSGGQDLTEPTAVTAPGATSFTAGALPASTELFYVVRARDEAGNIDANTVEVSATTPATEDRTAPTFAGLAAIEPAGSSAVTLSWRPASDDVTPQSSMIYRVYGAGAPGSQDFGSPWQESAPGAVEVLLSDLVPGATYYFVVRALDQAGNEDTNTVELAVTTGDAISFAAQVEPLLDATCAGNACHDSVMPAQDLDLTAGASYQALVNAASTQCADRLLVAPSQPEASYLIDKLLGTNLCSGSRMPKNGSLTPAQIQIVTDWVREGALDN